MKALLSIHTTRTIASHRESFRQLQSARIWAA